MPFSIPETVTPELQQLPICAIDMGYSNKNRSCGIAFEANGNPPDPLHFGELRGTLVEWFEALADDEPAVLILETPLSQAFHAPERPSCRSGNPVMRRVESGANYQGVDGIDAHKYAPWYSGPGAAVSLAVTRLLEELGELEQLGELDSATTIHLFEGFHPRWLADPDNAAAPNWEHGEVAQNLIIGFRANPPWVTQPNAPEDMITEKNVLQLGAPGLVGGHEDRIPLVAFASDTLFNAFDA